MKIRRFRAEDIDTILDIEKEAFPKTPYPKETFLHYATELPDSFVVIERGEDIGGYLLFDMAGHILSMAVRAALRRKGLGKQLFIHALGCVKKRLWLEVRSKNSGAIAFYQKMGMRLVGRNPGYYEDDDAVIMLHIGENEKE